MEGCITPYPEEAVGELQPFPRRLYAVPPRIASGSVPGVSVETYEEDNRVWKKHVNAYKKINRLLDTGRYRNIMDMNAGLGGFAAALHSPKLWVMNVMPTIAEKNTLGVIYERGLIGIYHDWYPFLCILFFLAEPPFWLYRYALKHAIVVQLLFLFVFP